MEERQDENKIKSVSRIQCSGCGKFFVGDSLFDQHRTGKFDDHTRHCLTTEEMEARGLTTEKRLVRFVIAGQNQYQERDVWYSPEAREKVREMFR